MNPYYRLFIGVLLLISVGCAGVFTPPTDNDVYIEITPTLEESDIEHTAEDQSTVPLTLNIWVTPNFDPALDSDASHLFQEKIDDFSKGHPGVRVIVRVKNLTGSAGMLESLTAANRAAPLALPDLILIPSTLLYE
ncbi:MAG: hypothetical protein N2D54_13055, partial [Chloroflexota bacterium]